MDAAVKSALRNRGEEWLREFGALCSESVAVQRSMVNLLPWVFKLHGSPYTIVDHFPFEPVFSLRIPKRTIWKCGRQVAKTTSLSADSVLRSLVTPFLKTLCITPRVDQIHIFSSVYVRPFIENSPIVHLMVDKHLDQAVLRREFPNGSMLFFTFAFMSPDRVRGISVDRILHDEVQDMDPDFMPVFRECTSASPLALLQYSGTPKTIDNTIESLWQNSSQAEWLSKCSCGYSNVASLNADLLKMIGRKGVVCAKCNKPLNVRDGHWHHVYPDKANIFTGYHIPQIILPLHNENSEKWAELMRKYEGRDENYTQAKFHNEVLGESCDVGVKLVTLAELKAACNLPWNNVLDEALRHTREYSIRSIGVDWGGGGAEEVSTTVITVMGWSPVHRCWDVLYVQRLPVSIDYFNEVKTILHICKVFRPNWVAHDFGGAGTVREALLVQAGMDPTTIMPILYTGANQRDTVVHHPPTQDSSRHYYSIPKSRFLSIVFASIKVGLVRFPQWQSAEPILKDLLALHEERVENRGADVYLIRRNPSLTDDAAHSLAYACCALWHTQSNYPQLAARAEVKYSLTDEQVAELEPLRLPGQSPKIHFPKPRSPKT